VHVSGHASAGELLYCYNIVKPRNVLPVHGEWRHMYANAQLAKQTGVPEGNVLIAEDGVVIDLIDGRAEIVGKIDCGYVYVDGSNIGGTDEALLKDRRILRDEGFITCVIVLDAASGKIASGPEITARGFAEGDEIFEQVIPKVERAVEEAVAGGVRDDYQLQQVVRRAIGSWAGGKIRRRPMIIPVVLQA
jgi:ribonuclease J